MKVKKLNENFELIEDIVEETSVETEEPINECDELIEKAIKDYRNFANIDESFEINSENIDSWALNEAASKYGFTRADLKHRLLGEEITLDQAERALETDAEVAEDKTIIEQELDASLKRALWMKKRDIRSNFPNKLFISMPGAGKTQIIYQWAKANDVNIIYKDCKTVDMASLGGILTKPTSTDDQYAGRLATKEFHVLDQPKTVLFLDELNRAPSNIQGSLLTLINDHTVWDPAQPHELRYLPNFLFTIAAINPPSLREPSLKNLGPAMLNRFKGTETPGKPKETLNYLRKYYTNLIKQEEDDEDRDEDMIRTLKGRLALAETILMDPKFKYDTIVDDDAAVDDLQYRQLSPRSFVDALENSDGTKQGFLDQWNGWCNYKKKHIIEDILLDFVDIDDKANDALKDGTESDVFADVLTPEELLRRTFGDVDWNFKS